MQRWIRMAISVGPGIQLEVYPILLPICAFVLKNWLMAPASRSAALQPDGAHFSSDREELMSPSGFGAVTRGLPEQSFDSARNKRSAAEAGTRTGTPSANRSLPDGWTAKTCRPQGRGPS